MTVGILTGQPFDDWRDKLAWVRAVKGFNKAVEGETIKAIRTAGDSAAFYLRTGAVTQSSVNDQLAEFAQSVQCSLLSKGSGLSPSFTKALPLKGRRSVLHVPAGTSGGALELSK